RSGALFALVDVDCTIERTELDLRFALVQHTEEAVAEFRFKGVRVRWWLEVGLAVHSTPHRSGAHIERIRRREAHFDQSAVVFQPISAVGKKFAVEEDVTGPGLRADAVAPQIDQLYIAADGR